MGLSYDLSEDYLKFVIRSTYDSGLRRDKISHGNIVGEFKTETITKTVKSFFFGFRLITDYLKTGGF